MAYVELANPTSLSVVNYYIANTKGDKRFELSNHPVNVLEVITDRKLPAEGTDGGAGTVDYFTADVVTYSDYYPYGMTMPNRNGQDESYRYGFNGMEEDSEIKGSKNSYDFGARLYDPRVGRWLSLDPLQKMYPSLSPYNFVANSPMIFVDPDGERIKFSKSLSREERKTYKAELRCLRKNSPTFKAMYKELKKSEETYTYSTTDIEDADRYDPETKTIFVNFDLNSDGNDITNTIAHETGHMYRDDQGLDPSSEDNPYKEGTIESNAYKSNLFIHKEYEGLHIDNIVRSELGSELREEYGELSTVSASFPSPVVKNQPDLSKAKKVNPRMDQDYDYDNREKNHIEDINKRKINPKDVKVYEYEKQEDFE